MRLDFFDLRLFLNIVDTGSLTRGAERSAISLQAASERIKKLEQQYQVSLFSRHSGGVKMTFAGQVFAEHAQALLQQGQQLSQAMAGFSEGLNSNISLWCNSSAQSEYLPLLLPQYLVNNPNIQIDLKEAESNDIIAALVSGTAKLGLISSFFPAPQLQTLEFSDDPLVLICPEQHDLATNPALKLADCLNYPFVGLMQYYSLQQSIETQARLLNCEIQYRLRLPNFAAIAQVVANGVGIAIMPKRAAQHLSKLYAFQQIQLTGDWANRKLLLAAKSFDELSTAYQHFSQFLISADVQKILN
ncbi:LysR family transcriptional regulator [Acinetobacter bohemicus]|uniref:LysR family transcriptional regulator n=1 Tax=Acinetobacter TaxID=469 RepID=UPI00157C5040|nr:MULTISPECIES: LysR family transcriptional regulator [Acinetobacter]MCO8042372.1 LysR family transcriptional regulator [Acinetobacter sp. S4400-12]MCU7224666.1 LysR family transcriptional regulator [Acinetobacter bohemicus]QKQ71257.1 LysR family transcriptional regulator [Acinetobacter sp. 10FS3-1]